VDTKTGFFDLYAKLDEKVLPKAEVKEEVKATNEDEIAF
jgi:hypothetical protein